MERKCPRINIVSYSLSRDSMLVRYLKIHTIIILYWAG